MAINQDKLNEFMGKAIGDIGAALSANMVLLGDKLGLYKAMAMMGPVTPAELAKATKTAERYIREWLGNQEPDSEPLSGFARGSLKLKSEPFPGVLSTSAFVP